MRTITKRVDFHAAHMLNGHGGLCKNLHGHTYVLDVTIKDMENENEDMIFDFYNLKHVLNDHVVNKFDHATIMGSDDIGTPLYDFCMSNGLKHIVLDVTGRSTSERIAQHIFNKLKPELPNIVSVRLYETNTSWVDITGGKL